ncbi:MAG: hypothetical protein JEZ07_12855 [Phycisphaerae bacterium]|nr:hypothetical protein [Phycisphaerae bacterium]
MKKKKKRNKFIDKTVARANVKNKQMIALIASISIVSIIGLVLLLIIFPLFDDRVGFRWNSISGEGTYSTNRRDFTD